MLDLHDIISKLPLWDNFLKNTYAISGNALIVNKQTRSITSVNFQ